MKSIGGLTLKFGFLILGIVLFIEGTLGLLNIKIWIKFYGLTHLTTSQSLQSILAGLIFIFISRIVKK